MEWTAYLDTITTNWRSILAIVVSSLVALAVVMLVRFGINRIALKRRSTQWLEIIPPANVAKTPGATQHLFTVLHGLRATRTIPERLLGKLPVMSCEIVSTKSDGIRFLLQVDEEHSQTVQKTITSYIPDSKVNEVEPPLQAYESAISFRQQKHYVLPITTTSPIEQHDPLSYITGAMTKLEDDEAITMQLIVTPLKLMEAQRFSKRIMHNEDVLRRVQTGNTRGLSPLFDSFNGLTMGTAELFGEFFTGTTHSYRAMKNQSKDAQLQAQITTRQRPARTLSAFELELMESMHQKLNKPLFHVDLRIMIHSSAKRSHSSALRSALDAYAMPPYQELRARHRLPVLSRYTTALAGKRLPSLHRKLGLVLSANEVASLYHFPSSRISKTDNMVSSLSRTLAAPVSLKSGQQNDIIIGKNVHHGTTTQIGLTNAERERHMYIIGGTGNGKTTMLQYAIIQDIQKGKGVAIVDPHGDMAETILRHIPEHRIKDVVYFNPDDLEYPFAMNLLELSPDLSGNDLLREKDMITESVVSIFRKIFSDDDSGGHRIEYVLRNAVHTALTVEGATLFTVLKLLQSPAYRRDISNKLEDENLRDFWKNELGKAGDMQKVKMSAGITAKIGRFNVNAAAKQILGQEKSTIDFEDIMNSGKILICNFSKGLLGEDVSELFGITILAKLQFASLQRARVKQSERRPYYLYVDEFQNFATPSFVQMLSESRKYKLFLTMAEQSTSQQKDQTMVSVILANVGTVICFRTGNPNDERLLLPLFRPFIDEGEIANLPAYSFFARLSSVISQEPLSGQTLLIEELENDEAAKNAVKMSRKLYAYKPEDTPRKKSAPRSKSDKKDTKVEPRSKPTVAVIGHE
ncbi:MAG: type IV secretion system DNA-binding domain-containing protein [Candidatus Saccharimonadales bacterium]